MRLFRRLLLGAWLLMGSSLFAAGSLNLFAHRTQVVRPEALHCLPVIPEPSISGVGSNLSFSRALGTDFENLKTL